jgi:hypothetical protein
MDAFILQNRVTFDLQYAEALAISDFQNEIMQVVKMQHS